MKKFIQKTLVVMMSIPFGLLLLTFDHKRMNRALNELTLFFKDFNETYEKSSKKQITQAREDETFTIVKLIKGQYLN